MVFNMRRETRQASAIGNKQAWSRLGFRLASALAICASSPAQAEDLRSVLQRTLENSPTLAARRASLAAQGEDIVAARVTGRPSLTATSSFTENVQYQLPSVFNPDRRVGADLFLNLPIYQGGRVANAIGGAQQAYGAGWEDLQYSVSELLQQAVVAYGNVLRDDAVLEMAENDVANLETNLRAAQGRFRIGDLTMTDVAQSEARLALARASVFEARTALARSREEYVLIVGAAPVQLEAPEFSFQIPATEREAIALALRGNSALRAARYRFGEAEFRVRAARSERLPKVRATGSVRYFNYLRSINSDLPFEPREEGTGIEVGVSMELPLYQGGGPASLVRRATNQRASAREEGLAVERAVVARVRTAYASLRHLADEEAEARLAVSASEQALRGARIEHEFGTRTLVDVLDAQRELLNAQINVLTVERDLFFARFFLAAAMGKAVPGQLGLVSPARANLMGPPPPRSSWSDWADGPRVIPVRGTSTAEIASDVDEWSGSPPP